MEKFDEKMTDVLGDEMSQDALGIAADTVTAGPDGSCSAGRPGRKYVPLTVFIVLLIAAVLLTAGISWFALRSGGDGELQGTVLLQNDLKTVEKFSSVVDDQEAIEVDMPDDVAGLKTVASGRRSDAGTYLNSLGGGVRLGIADTDEHKNLVNGKTTVTYEDVCNVIGITKTEKVNDNDYNKLAQCSYALPATASVGKIFPGAVLFADNNAAYGHASSVNEELGKESFTIVGALNSGVSETFELDTPNGTDVIYTLYDSLSETDCNYDIRVTDVTSPEQTAIELGVAAEDIKNFLSGYWEGIRTGSKQVAVAYIRRNVAEVQLDGIDAKGNFGNNGNFFDIGKLFSDNASVDDIKSLIKDQTSSLDPNISFSNAMYVKNVKYGNAYLVSAVLESGRAYDPGAANSFRDIPELREGLLNYFRGDSGNIDQSQKNALTYAKYEVSRIGGKPVNDYADPEKWSPAQQISLSAFTRELAESYRFTEEDTLVPLSYEANSISGKQDAVSMSAKAEKYRMSYVTGTVTDNIILEEKSKGVATEREVLNVYGLDLNAFNSGNTINERPYKESKGKTFCGKFKAYECVFGIMADASAWSCTCRAYSADRVVSNGIYKGKCTGKNTGGNGEITGPVDLGRGLTIRTTDWTRDAYFIINGKTYKGTNGLANNDGSDVRISREYNATRNGNDLKYYNAAAADLDIIQKAIG